mmetsp:Transcript_3145/g.4830  ORF Transcript_3145/g.4830 Transcript_3145/m.4830 type:complete len:627 (-) Transcript_3145:272-2152(-)
MPTLIDYLIELRDDKRNTKCKIELITSFRSPSTHLRSSFYFDHQRRHSRKFETFQSYLQAAKQCQPINSQLAFLFGGWEKSKSCQHTNFITRNKFQWALKAISKFDHVGVSEDLDFTIRWFFSKHNYTNDLSPKNNSTPDPLFNTGSNKKNVGKYDVNDNSSTIACSLAEYDNLIHRFAFLLVNAIKDRFYHQQNISENQNLERALPSSPTTTTNENDNKYSLYEPGSQADIYAKKIQKNNNDSCILAPLSFAPTMTENYCRSSNAIEIPYALPSHAASTEYNFLKYIRTKNINKSDTAVTHAAIEYLKQNCYINPMWDRQFGNAFFIWAEYFGLRALCGVSFPKAKRHNIYNINYCPSHDPNASPLNPACQGWLRSRNIHNGGKERKPCYWSIDGNAWSYLLPYMRVEFTRALYAKLYESRTSNHDEINQPCNHVKDLPKKTSYIAIHIRCGDFMNPATRGHHSFLKTEWYLRILRLIYRSSSDDEYIIILGNRKSHSTGGQEISKTCDSLFNFLKSRFENEVPQAAHKVLIAPEINGPQGIFIDTFCMMQSRILILGSSRSTFGKIQSSVHNGCASYFPDSNLTSHHHQIAARERHVLEQNDDLLDPYNYRNNISHIISDLRYV